MRKYSLIEDKKITQIKCNSCGKELKIENGIVMEGVFSVDYSWGYFSNKDGEIHSFDVCEKCYNHMIRQFQLPIDKDENKELI